jgi:hypothetical protein
MAMMAVSIANPVSLVGVDQFVGFKTAAAKVGDHDGGDRMWIVLKGRGGKSDTRQTYVGSSQNGQECVSSCFSRVGISPPSPNGKVTAHTMDAEGVAALTQERIATAPTTQGSATADLAGAKAELETANARLAAAQAASDLANSRYEAAKAALDAAMVAFNADPVNPDLGAALDDAGFDLDQAVAAQVDHEMAVEKASIAQVVAAAVHDAAIQRKDAAQSRLDTDKAEGTYTAASGQLAAVTVVSNDKTVSGDVLDALRHLLGI